MKTIFPFSIIPLLISALFLILPCSNAFSADTLLAFPGADGGGKYSKGARGASSVSVYHVTNLNESGKGSFKDAVSKSGRIIVFDVSGTINLSGTLTIGKNNLTILGQTAPGDGITFTGGDILIGDQKKNIIMRYLRVRPTDKNGDEPDGIGGRWTNNVIIDHCSTSFSVDETLTLYAGSSEKHTPGSNNTVQYTISSESLRMSSHFKGSHGYGGIFGATLSTWHHNLLAHHDSRSPRLDRELQGTDIRNNVFYNWGLTNSMYGGEPFSYNNITQTPSKVNIVNNYYKFGPGTADKLKSRILQAPGAVTVNDVTTKSEFYINGNFVNGYPSITSDNWKGVYELNGVTKLEQPTSMTDSQTNINYDLSETQSAEDAYISVLENVGATLPKRDAIDARIVADVKNGTGRIINKADEVGGGTATQKSETREFTIPSDWKTENSMGNAKETDIVSSGKWAGYTWIEAYVNDWTMKQSTPTNPDITVLSPAVQSLSDTINDQSIDNGAWAVIYEDEPLNYKALITPNGNTTITEAEIFDGSTLIKTTTGSLVDEALTLSAGTHYLSIRAYNNKGEATQSPTSIVYVKSGNADDSFSHAQIGKTGDFNNKGGSWPNSGTYTIMGSGRLNSDGSGTAGVSSDKCDFMYKEVIGDFDITVKPEQIPKFENGAVAGIMMRETLDGNSRMIMLADGWLKYGENVRGIVRTAKGAVSTIKWFSGISNTDKYDTSDVNYHMPNYMRMQRNGDEITLSVSDSGLNWTDNPRQPMTITLSNLSDIVYLGLAVDSSQGVPQKEYMSEAKFSNLVLNAETPVPTTKPSEEPHSIYYISAPTLAEKTIECKIMNNTADDALFIAAIYSNDESILKYTIIDTIQYGENSISRPLNISSGDKIKAMIWDKNYCPVVNITELNY